MRVELGSSEGTALVVPHTVSVELTRVYMGKREVFHTANFLTAKLHGISLHSFTMANPEVLTPLRLSRFYGTTVWK